MQGLVGTAAEAVADGAWTANFYGPNATTDNAVAT